MLSHAPSKLKIMMRLPANCSTPRFQLLPQCKQRGCITVLVYFHIVPAFVVTESCRTLALRSGATDCLYQWLNCLIPGFGFRVLLPTSVPS